MRFKTKVTVVYARGVPFPLTNYYKFKAFQQCGYLLHLHYNVAVLRFIEDYIYFMSIYTRFTIAISILALEGVYKLLIK